MSRLSPAFRRFVKYAAVGISTLTFDLVLLYGVVEFAGVPYYLAVPLCFLVAVSVNYFVSRQHVFRGTLRSFRAGYVYFLLAAGGGAFITTSGVAFLVEVLGVHYLPARIGIAGLVGMANYLLNLHFNFKVAGHHPERSA